MTRAPVTLPPTKQCECLGLAFVQWTWPDHRASIIHHQRKLRGPALPRRVWLQLSRESATSRGSTDGVRTGTRLVAHPVGHRPANIATGIWLAGTIVVLMMCVAEKQWGGRYVAEILRAKSRKPADDWFAGSNSCLHVFPFCHDGVTSRIWVD